MIPSIARGGDMGGLLAYLAGPGRAEEHVNARVVAGSTDVLLLQELGGLDGGRARELARVLDAAHRRWGTTAPVAVKDRETGERTGTRDGHVWHCSLALPAGERLGDDRWAELAGCYVQEMKLEGCRWALIRHGDSKGGNDHAHLVIDLIRAETGKSASVHRDQSRAQAACARLAKRFGLEQVAGQQRHVARDQHREAAVKSAGAPGAPAAIAAEPGAEAPSPEPERVVPARPLVGRRLRLATALREATATACTPRELVVALRARGVLSRWTRRPGGKVDGLVVWEGARRGERRVFERAGQLDRDLALPRLLHQLNANATRAARREPGAALKLQPPPGAHLNRGPGRGRGRGHDFGR